MEVPCMTALQPPPSPPPPGCQFKNQKGGDKGPHMTFDHLSEVMSAGLSLAGMYPIRDRRNPEGFATSLELGKSRKIASCIVVHIVTRRISSSPQG